MTLYINIEPYLQQYKTKQLALFHAMRDIILSGKQRPHHKLPTTRLLAEQLSFSRGTVNDVYDMLTAQGYIYTVGGSGTYVSHHTELTLDSIQEPAKPTLSKWGSRLLLNNQPYTNKPARESLPSAFIDTSTISFQLNLIDFNQFPLQEWNKVMYEHTRQQYNSELVSQYTTDGHPNLKQAIAQHLHTHRGIVVEDNQIVIVNGSQQALSLLMHLLIDEGDEVALENPHYTGIRHIIQTVGGKIKSFPVDEEGILFKPQQQHYKLIYITPNRQFPTGSVLSMERRQHILKWAYEHQCFIVEDDYDSEFTYERRALEPLKALDTYDNVIYIGTFSRTMMQHIRIGYAVLPRALCEPFIKAKLLFERHPSSIIQQGALASFMQTGLYDRHLRRMRRLYRERAQFLIEQLSTRLSQLFSVNPLKAGLHIYAYWIGPSEKFYPFLEACEHYRVRLVNSEAMYDHSPRQAVCFGFAHLSKEEIEEGIERITLAYQHLT